MPRSMRSGGGTGSVRDVVCGGWGRVKGVVDKAGVGSCIRETIWAVFRYVVYIQMATFMATIVVIELLTFSISEGHQALDGACDSSHGCGTRVCSEIGGVGGVV